MPSTLWNKVTGPSAGLVKQHYVDARLDALYRRDKNLERKLASVFQSVPSLKGQTSGDKWLKVYEKITAQLQASQLTINFEADSWFTTPNLYPSYTTGYQRSGTGAHGEGLFQDTNMNPAVMRGKADDKISFNNLAGDKGATGPARGLSPGRQGTDRIKAQMAFDPKKNMTTVPGAVPGVGDKKFAVSNNKHFNAQTKQVFAALNYGRRPNGSSTYYGMSYLVLKPKFKVNALYYGGDTFYAKDASQQAAYHVLGTLLAWADDGLRDAIIQSCFFGTRLANDRSPAMLVEAHLFDEVTFANNLEEVVVSCEPRSIQHDNARLFADAHGARLTLIA